MIPRHDGRVIWLTYTPDGPVEQTLLLVGKGVTYDTGGADIKAGGNISRFFLLIILNEYYIKVLIRKFI